MRKFLILKKLNSAEKAREKMNSCCEDIAKELQPYFNEEIDVFFQPSDGFVVILNLLSDSCDQINIQVDVVTNTICKDENYYKKLYNKTNLKTP